MRIGYRNVLAATFVLTPLVFLTALAAWAATSARQTVHAGPADKLTRASACVASAYHVKPGENATIAIGNDGGWCWADTYERSNWHTLSANSIAVTYPSKHGHVLVRDIDNQEVQIAYQPKPGFAGQDSRTSLRYR